MKHRKRIVTLIAVFVLITGITVSSIALADNNTVKSSGSFSNPIADRLAVELKNTQFTVKKTGTSPETFTLTMYLSLNKTQSDFYAIVNSLNFSGISYDNIIFSSENEHSRGIVPQELILTADNEEPTVYKWRINLNVTVVNTGNYSGELALDFAAGISKDTAQQKVLSIPIKITVE